MNSQTAQLIGLVVLLTALFLLLGFWTARRIEKDELEDADEEGSETEEDQ